jgi:alanine racemase
MEQLVWCEIDRAALAANLQQLRRLMGPGPILAATVKANAYGHGLELAARTFADAGADWLCVNALYEARRLREAGITLPLYLVGYVPPADVADALELDCQLVLYDPAVADAASAAIAQKRATHPPAPRGPARLHLKLETGNNRQGLREDEALELARRVHADPNLELTGLATHFADVEDTTDHTFAHTQHDRFVGFARRLHAEGIDVALRHMSNSAAAILWPAVHMELARVGIACYGMWPSSESYVSALLIGRAQVQLTPALAWKTRVVQVREVPSGEFVSYGRTFRTTHVTRLAVLPVGYYDGYDRGLSNLAHVLIRGRRAPVRGRVCMNLTMVDVTDIPGAGPGDEVVLLGTQGDERLTAEQLAGWAGTINYEITTRINDRIPRIPV